MKSAPCRPAGVFPACASASSRAQACAMPRRPRPPLARRRSWQEKHRIEKRERIADQDPPRSSHPRRIVGIVAGDAHLAGHFSMFDSALKIGVFVERLEQEFRRASLPLRKVLWPPHRADTHDAARQRDHPHPALIETVNTDVAGILARPKFCAAEVTEYGGALMQVVLAPQLVLRSDKRIAAAGIDDIARLNAVVAAVIGLYFEQRFARAFLLDFPNLLSLTGIGAAGTRMIVEHLVEILAPNLKGVRRTVADGARKGEGVVAAFVVRLEIRAQLVYAERAHLVEHTQAFEDRQIHRQERLADVKPRMASLLERNDLVAAPRQQDGRGAPRRAAADHRHVANFGYHVVIGVHVRSSLRIFPPKMCIRARCWDLKSLFRLPLLRECCSY